MSRSLRSALSAALTSAIIVAGVNGTAVAQPSETPTDPPSATQSEKPSQSEKPTQADKAAPSQTEKPSADHTPAEVTTSKTNPPTTQAPRPSEVATKPAADNSSEPAPSATTSRPKARVVAAAVPADATYAQVTCTEVVGADNDNCTTPGSWRYASYVDSRWSQGTRTYTWTAAAGHTFADGSTTYVQTLTDSGVRTVVTPVEPTWTQVPGSSTASYTIPDVPGVCYSWTASGSCLTPGVRSTSTNGTLTIYARPADVRLYEFPAGTPNPTEYTHTYKRTWHYYCAYVGGTQKFTAQLGTVTYAEDRPLPADLEWGGATKSAAQENYCRALDDPFADAKLDYSWYSSSETDTMWTCKAGVRGTTSGYPADYKVSVRFNLGGPDQVDYALDINAPFDVKTPAGATNVSVRIIRGDGSLATALLDSSAQCIPTKNYAKLGVQKSCDGFTVRETGAFEGDRVRLTWTDVAGETHTEEMPVDDVGVVVNNPDWKSGEAVVLRASGYVVEETRISFETDMATCHPVTAAVVTFEQNPVCGANNDEINGDLPEGVSYVNPPSWQDNVYTIEIMAEPGYVLSEGQQTKWSFVDDAQPCTTPTPTPTPTEPTPTVPEEPGPATTTPKPTPSTKSPAPAAVHTADPGRTLPQTGSELGAQSALGAVLLGLGLTGAGILVMSRGRRRS